MKTQMVSSEHTVSFRVLWKSILVIALLYTAVKEGKDVVMQQQHWREATDVMSRQEQKQMQRHFIIQFEKNIL